MKLKITFAVTVLVALLVAPPALAGPGKAIAKRAAKAACKAETADLGREAFREKYGRRAMRACMRARAGEAIEAVENAAHECRAERQADPEQFREDYGTNKNKRNAFGKCVAGKVHDVMAGGENDENDGETPPPPPPPAP